LVKKKLPFLGGFGVGGVISQVETLDQGGLKLLQLPEEGVRGNEQYTTG